jgi:orotate phosphoribosyltransferase-like protein
MRAPARERARAFSFSEVIMPVVDERLIAKAMALRKQRRTQEEIAVELGVVQGTVRTILRQHGLGEHLALANKRTRRS